ncbi:MAG TPA: hypothetical protein DCY94_01145 [Firmicutes bacterium]|nr:hypothetical protein [Bacillota bacterium]
MEEKMPRHIKTLRYMDESYCENNLNDAMTSFIYTDEEDVEHRFTNVYHYSNAKRVSDRIVDWSGEFVNGFMVVRFEDGLFGYVSEETREVMKPRFTIASDFDKYGYAMVGLRKGVSFIDRNFDIFLGNWQNCVSDIEQSAMAYNLSGISRAITKFSEGSIPLASVLEDRNLYFIGPDGNYQFFKRYDGTVGENERYKFCFNAIKLFNPSGYLILDDEVLFASGFYCTKDSLWKLARDGKYDFFEKMSQSMHEEPFIENDPKKINMLPVDKKGAEE